MFSSQLNMKDLFSTNNTRNVSRQESDFRESQLSYSQVDFPESQLQEINSQQFSTQSSESPGRKPSSRYASKSSLLLRETQQRGQTLAPQSNYQQHVQQQRSKTREREEREHLNAVLGLVRECMTEVKSTVSDIRSSMDCNSRNVHDSLASSLQDLQSNLERHNEEMIKTLKDRDDMKTKISLLQQELAAKDSRIEQLEKTVQDYREQQNQLIIKELQKSLSTKFEDTKKHIDKAYKSHNQVVENQGDKLDTQCEKLTKQTDEAFYGVLKQTSLNIKNAARNICEEVREQKGITEQKMTGLQSELRERLNQNQQAQKEEVRALLRQQMQILDAENERRQHQQVETQTRQLAEMQSQSKLEILEQVKENISDLVADQKSDMQQLVEGIWQAEKREREIEQMESQCRRGRFESNQEGSANRFLQHSGIGNVCGASSCGKENNGSIGLVLRRSRSESNFDRFNTGGSAKPGSQSPPSHRVLQDFDRTVNKREKMPRSRSQSFIEKFSQSNEGQQMKTPSFNWDLKEIFEARNRSASGNLTFRNRNTYTPLSVKENSTSELFKTRSVSSERPIKFSEFKTSELPTTNNRYSNTGRRYMNSVPSNRNWTSKFLFSKSNPSPSPVATVLPLVQSSRASTKEVSQNKTGSGSKKVIPQRSVVKENVVLEPRITRSKIPQNRQCKQGAKDPAKTKGKKGRKRKGGKRAITKNKKQKSIDKDDENAKQMQTQSEGLDTQHTVDSDDEESSQYISNRYQMADISSFGSRSGSKPLLASDVYEFSEHSSLDQNFTDTMLSKKAQTTYSKFNTEQSTRKAPRQSELLWNRMDKKSDENTINSPVLSTASENQDDGDMSSVGSSPTYTVADVVLKRSMSADGFRTRLNRENNDKLVDKDDMLSTPNINAYLAEDCEDSQTNFMETRHGIFTRRRKIKQK